MSSNNKKEYRAVNEVMNGSSVSVILPKRICKELNIGKGNYVKVWMEDKKIFMEKAE